MEGSAGDVERRAETLRVVPGNTRDLGRMPTTRHGSDEILRFAQDDSGAKSELEVREFCAINPG